MKNKTGFKQTQDVLKKIRNNGTKCIKCKKPISSTVTGIQKVRDGYMCDDCYFDALGEEIEKHPIVSPRRIGR